MTHEVRSMIALFGGMLVGAVIIFGITLHVEGRMNGASIGVATAVLGAMGGLFLLRKYKITKR